jgi:hypothetical protein
MQKWEYYVENFGGTLDESNGPAMLRFLNERGQAGWELVGVEPWNRGPGVEGRTAYYKRPAEQ